MAALSKRSNLVSPKFFEGVIIVDENVDLVTPKTALGRKKDL